jgi:hypothetical protein
MGLIKDRDIPLTAHIYKLLARMGSDSVVVESDTSVALHAQLVTIIDEITSSSDKMNAIRQLHALKREHPTLDIPSYLMRISTAFRRFVLDTLVKLDAASAPVDENIVNQQVNRVVVKEVSPAAVDKLTATAALPADGPQETVRTYEGLKLKSTPLQDSDLPR